MKVHHSLNSRFLPDPLPRDQENQLVSQAQQGDQTATQTLIDHNSRWIAKEVNRRASYGIDREDLLQAATEGLITAINKFDVTQDVRLITFAKHHIIGALKKLQAQMGQPHRIAINIYDARSKIRKTEVQLWLELGRQPTDQEIRAKVTVGDNEWEAYQQLRTIHWKSLNSDTGGYDQHDTDPQVSGNQTAERTLIGDVWQPENNPTEQEILKQDHLHTLRNIVLQLPEHEAKTIGLLYGLEDGEPRTKTQIAEQLGLTEFRVYAIIASATARMRHPGFCYQLVSTTP